MMAAWMLYTLITTLLLIIAGSAAERLMRALRAPTRVVWTAAIATAIALSAVSLLGHRAISSPRRTASTVATGGTMRVPAPQSEHIASGGSAFAPPRTRVTNVYGPAAGLERILVAASLRLDQARWDRYDGLLAAICASLATMGILLVILSLARLRSIVGTLSGGELEGVAVLLSDNVGPAVAGFVRARVVIPRWVATLASAERRTILLHEQEHAAARDPALLLLGVVALALQPWNVPLWIAVSRLRFALEVDCDARVLARGRLGTRRYGALLLQVHEQERRCASANRIPVTAFVDSTSHLERRIRRMTGRQPRARSLSTVCATLLVVVGVGMAFSVRVSGARETTRTAKAPRPTLEMTSSPVGVAAPLSSDSALASAHRDVRISHLLRNALPEVANSEHAALPSDLRVTLSAMETKARDAGPADRGAAQRAFTPETLFLQSSNPSWPMKARITFSGHGAAQVAVLNRAGQTLPVADTLVVAGGPVRLVLPEAQFHLNFESLAGDLSITTSPTLDRKGGARWVGTVLGRNLVVFRDTADVPIKVSATGAGFVKGQRVP